MNTTPNTQPRFAPEVFARLGAPHIVYVRELAAQEAAAINLPVQGLRLFAIHAADGTRVGIMDNRDAAFAAARQNDMEPVSVH